MLFAALLLPLSAYAAKNILVFGDSLSAGYGIAIEKSWAYLLQHELERTQSGFSIVNASISGETTAGGRQRIAKALKQHRPAIVIVALGANDGLRGYKPADIETNLGRIIEQAQRAGAKVLLVESTAQVGGTTSYSAGTTWIPGTHLAPQVNRDDTLDTAAKKHHTEI